VASLTVHVSQRFDPVSDSSFTIKKFLGSGQAHDPFKSAPQTGLTGYVPGYRSCYLELLLDFKS
jgi:hypothetical protein